MSLAQFSQGRERGPFAPAGTSLRLRQEKARSSCLEIAGRHRTATSRHSRTGCWKPVITAVNGVCNAGGLHFIADTELVIASEGATFLDTHVAVGLVSALEPAGLARRIPLERVFRLALLGKSGRMSAQEALELGLVGEVVPAPELMPKARQAAAVMAQYSPTALARTKRAIWESLDRSLNEGLDAAHAQVERQLEHPDPMEGAKAFLEKRQPEWAPYRGTD